MTFLPAFDASAFKTSALLYCASPLSLFTDGTKETLGKKLDFLIALRGLLILVFFLGEADRREGRLGGAGLFLVVQKGLNDIGLTIVRGYPRRAMSFVRELRERCRKITEAPKAYRRVRR